MVDEAPSNTRAVVAVLGTDRPGIVAGVATTLAAHRANILDMSQTILQGTFTMTMLVDLADLDVEFKALHTELAELAEALGVQISLQREELFRLMYRL